MYTFQPLGFKKFGADDRGAVAITFGVMAMALFFMAGIAVDYSRVMNVRGRLIEAADAAVLAAGKALQAGQSEGAIQTLALTYFKENVKAIGEAAEIGEPTISIDATTGSVNLDVNATVDMTLSGLGGFKTQDVAIESQAVFSTRDIEIGMALDITGSMCDAGRQPCTTGAKIDGLKNAFETFANRLMPDNSDSVQKVRIAVAPYSQSVNLGSYAANVGGYTAGNTWATERVGGGYTDELGAFYFGRSGDRDVDSTEGRADFNTSSRPQSSIIPLSDDKAALVSAVRALEARGGTAGHLGTQWAWNLVSDKWGDALGGTAPASYSDVADGKVIKAVVIMTDGIFNTAYHGGKSSTQAVGLCNAMKAQGVTVFTVGFGIGSNATALSTLRDCATPGNGYFANASNAEELERAFENFASKLTELRLSK
jgi:Flp pilus assembly protein TadG